MTGWTWVYVHDEVTLPQVHVLSTYWRQQPPMPILARRLCQYFGIQIAMPTPKVAASPDDAMQEAMSAGLPVTYGRPDDPMLDLLDLP